MPIKIAAADSEPVALADFIAYIEANVDFRDRDSLLRSAPMLQRLAANERFLGDWLIEQLSSPIEWFQQKNAYNYQSFVLNVTDDYLLRANFWVPPGHLERYGARAAAAFGYGAYHNHNFDLLTVGYAGSGYETDMLRMRDPYAGHDVGDVPDFEPLGRWHLGRGDVMFYDAFADVHCQHAPPDLSVSINLMTHSTRETWPQYTFDASDHAITAMVGSPLDSRIHALTIARGVVPEAADEALRKLAAGDPSARLRKLARDALADRFTDWQ